MDPREKLNRVNEVITICQRIENTSPESIISSLKETQHLVGFIGKLEEASLGADAIVNELLEEAINHRDDLSALIEFRDNAVCLSIDLSRQTTITTTNENVVESRRRRLSFAASQDPHRDVDIVIIKVKNPSRIHHQDPETVQNRDRSLGKIYTTIKLSTMSLIEILENLFNYDSSVIASSTNFGSTTKFQELMFLRTKDSHDPGRPSPPIDTETH